MIAMKESIANIQLSKGPTLCDSNRENGPNRRGLDHRAEDLKEINSSLLMVALGYEASFPTINGTIGKTLSPENLTKTNKISALRGRDKSPSVGVED